MKVDPSWLVRPQIRPDAELRLFCFHHAGGGAAFFTPWASALPGQIELVAVRLPGRESTFGRPRFTDVDDAVEAVCTAVLPLLDRPFAIFGHSLGALIAYRTALSLERVERQYALHLFCSGLRAPHLPRLRRSLLRLPDAELVAELRRHGGISDAVAKHDELLALTIPLLRDDLMLAEGYSHDDAIPLAAPITAMGGEKDELTSPQELAGWETCTTGCFRLLTYPGDHFFLVEERERVIADIAAVL